MRYRLLSLFPAVIGIAACRFLLPAEPAIIAAEPERTLTKPIAAAYDDALRELTGRGYTIVHAEARQGRLRVRYEGNPEGYVDCGELHVTESNNTGAITRTLPAARALVRYERVYGHRAFSVQRRLHLIAEIELWFVASGVGKTRVQALSHYSLERQLLVQPEDPEHRSRNDSLTFDSSATAHFGDSIDGSVSCAATGLLERDTLSALSE